MKQVVLNIEDRILEEFRAFKIANKDNKDLIPRYLMLDKASYRLLKDQFEVPEYEEIASFGGWLITLIPEGNTTIKFI